MWGYTWGSSYLGRTFLDGKTLKNIFRTVGSDVYSAVGESGANQALPVCLRISQGALRGGCGRRCVSHQVEGRREKNTCIRSDWGVVLIKGTLCSLRV